MRIEGFVNDAHTTSSDHIDDVILADFGGYVGSHDAWYQLLMNGRPFRRHFPRSLESKEREGGTRSRTPDIVLRKPRSRNSWSSCTAEYRAYHSSRRRERSKRRDIGSSQSLGR